MDIAEDRQRRSGTGSIGGFEAAGQPHGPAMQGGGLRRTRDGYPGCLVRPSYVLGGQRWKSFAGNTIENLRHRPSTSSNGKPILIDHFSNRPSKSMSIALRRHALDHRRTSANTSRKRGSLRRTRPVVILLTGGPQEVVAKSNAKRESDGPGADVQGLMNGQLRDNRHQGPAGSGKKKSRWLPTPGCRRFMCSK